MKPKKLKGELTSLELQMASYVIEHPEWHSPLRIICECGPVSLTGIMQQMDPKMHIRQLNGILHRADEGEILVSSLREIPSESGVLRWHRHYEVRAHNKRWLLPLLGVSDQGKQACHQLSATGRQEAEPPLPRQVVELEQLDEAGVCQTCAYYPICPQEARGLALQRGDCRSYKRMEDDQI